MLKKPEILLKEQSLFFKGGFELAVEKVIAIEEKADDHKLILAMFYYLLGNESEASSWLHSVETASDFKAHLNNSLNLKYFHFDKIKPEKSQTEKPYASNRVALNSVIEYFGSTEIFEAHKLLPDICDLHKEQYFWTFDMCLSGQTVNGVFDTGASFFLCLDHELLAKEIENNNAIEIASFDLDAPLGEQEAKTALIKNMRIGNNTFANVPCMAFSFEQINAVTEGNTQFILGNTWLKKHRHFIDFENEVLSIDPLVKAESTAKTAVTSLKYISDSDQKMFTPITINGVKGLALWDSGSTTGFLLSRQFLMNQVKERKIKNLHDTFLDDGFSSVILGPGLDIVLGDKKMRLEKTVASHDIDTIAEALDIPFICSIGSMIHHYATGLVFEPENQEIHIHWK
jgi:hypothetical protein